MKILRISLRNIASLAGTHTVDFTRDPLRAAGLFAISGSTGAGKSTLLDALCLALYERTPRLNSIRGAVKLADGGDSISQKDSGNLLRRGTGEGFAEVAFVGVDDAAYTARWVVRRARNRPEGSLQNSEMTLYRGNVGPGGSGEIEQGGRKTEVLPAIAAKIGLSFEQFTRAVLLAQNDFATFLKADDKERAEILQALTGTGRFESLSIATFTRCGSEQRAVAEIEARLAGNAPLTADERRTEEAATRSADLAWSEIAEKVRQREIHASWFGRLGELSRQNGEAAKTQQERRAVLEAAAPRRRDLQFTEEARHAARPLWDAERRLHAEATLAEAARKNAISAEETVRGLHAAQAKQRDETNAVLRETQSALELAKPALLEARALDAQLAPLTERLTAAIRDRESAETTARQVTSTRDTLRQRRLAADSERAPLLRQRDALDSFAPLATQSASWLHRLDQAAAARRALESAAANRARRTEEEVALQAAAEGERATEAALRTAAQKAREAFEQTEASARRFDGDQIARARSEAEAVRTALRELEKHLQERSSISIQVAQTETEIAALGARIADDSAALTELSDRKIPAAELVAHSARRSCELAEAAVTDEAIRLREKLTPGQPCPVCGAAEHPHADHPPASEAAALRALRADCAARETEFRTLRETAAALTATRASRMAQDVEKRRSLATLHTQLQTVRAQRHEHPAAVAILDLASDQQSPALAAQLVAQQATIDATNTADHSRRNAEKALEERRKQCDSVTAELAAHEKRLTTFAHDLAIRRAALETAAATHAEAEKSLQDALAVLAPLFASSDAFRAAWEHDPAGFRETFTAMSTSFVALEKRLGELAALRREADAALTPVDEACLRAEAELAAKQSAENVARGVHDQVRAQRSAIFGGRPAADVEAEFSAKLNRASEALNLRLQELEKTTQQLTAAAQSLTSATQHAVEATSRESAARVALDAWLHDFSERTERPLTRTDLEILLSRDEAWIRAERAAFEVMEGAVRAAEGALEVHQLSLAAHLAARPTLDEEPAVVADLAALRIALGDAEKRRDHARNVIFADDRRIGDNATLAGELTIRRTRAEPWQKLNDLIGSSDGAKFRGIAQRRTLDILLGYANAQLDLLATRYRLERLPESLNLIVIDRDMGDERRSVHSLSGGESFLVSLALALALASLTSNRLRIESLFIDEGFGSLDPATLNVAMNALMHLEAQGRKVGVISHVSEMADAIPVQIRVVKGRSGASRLIVPGAAESAAASEDLSTEKSPAPPSGEIVAQILGILRREQAAGRPRVSSRMLREEIGCTSSEFNAARDALGDQIRSEGKSVALAAPPP